LLSFHQDRRASAIIWYNKRMGKIEVTIDDGGLYAALSSADKQTTDKARQALRSNSLLIEGIVKQDMPVDSGRARASWGHWTPGGLDRVKAKDADESDAIWEESPDGMTITQGTNVPYVQALNEGHSTQMGAGFIDNAAQLGAVNLINDLEKILGRIFG